MGHYALAHCIINTAELRVGSAPHSFFVLNLNKNAHFSCEQSLFLAHCGTVEKISLKSNKSKKKYVVKHKIHHSVSQGKNQNLLCLGSLWRTMRFKTMKSLKVKPDLSNLDLRLGVWTRKV